MQKAEIRELLALLDAAIKACATSVETVEAAADCSGTRAVATSIRNRGKLLADAHEAIETLAIRCGLLMPPRTVRLSDLVAGREPFELGTMDQLALALGNLIEVFRADGATLDAMARAFRFEAEALEAEDAEDQRRAGYEPIS